MFLFFAVLLIFFSVGVNLPLLPLAAGCGFFFLLYYFAFLARAWRSKKNQHILFSPVPLFPSKSRTYSLFPILMPFCAGAVLVLFLPLLVPFFSPSRTVTKINTQHQADAWNPDTWFLVSSEDFKQHIDFQRSFSFRPVNYGPCPDKDGPAQGALNQDGYMSYYLGDDGLIAGSQRIDDFWNGVPPFPLEKLMEFLINYEKSGAAGNIKEWISVVLILASCTLDLHGPGIRRRKLPVLWNKRIAA